MRALLMAFSTLAAVSLAATPAAAHVPSQCHPELREFMALQAEKFDRIAAVVTERQAELKKTRDAIFDEMTRMVAEGMETGQITTQEVDTDITDYSVKHYDIFVFDKTIVSSSLANWLNCLADHPINPTPEYDDLPPGYEALGPLLEDMREFANRPGQ